MENRLCLNKKPVYELPDGVKVGHYQKSINTTKGNTEPNFEPNLCLRIWGKSIKIENKYESNGQIWIKSSNKELIEFIKNYKIKFYGVSSPSISVALVKKIILEEFYGVKNGE